MCTTEARGTAVYRTGHLTAAPTPQGAQKARRPALALLLLIFAACGDSPREARSGPPNILFVVWDTARADRMSLYGHDQPTTPRLDAWAREALVFDDVVSAASYTVPSHASMFTGLLPSEHCATGEMATLHDDYKTLAELLREAGYATFLYAENPHLTEQQRISQGFSQHEHPWSPRYLERARAILKQKLDGDDTSELGDRLAEMERGERELTPWNVKAAGELAEDAVHDFIDATPANQPFFIFVNYMEAHRPYLPPRRYRERFMSPDQLEASYQVDRSWGTIWEYTFGQRDVAERDLALTRATYDATLRELDDLFGSLIDSLKQRGALRDTIVVLTSDHGEHLGEQHMFDHQSTLYEPALRVPLVLSFPGRLDAGRRPDPVMNFDVFPTLLELAGVPIPDGQHVSARSLLSAAPDRERLAQEPATESSAVRAMRRLHPGWNPDAWVRSQQALYRGRYKWIAPSHGDAELYDLDKDPAESRNLAALREIDAATLRGALARVRSQLVPCNESAIPELGAEDRALLEMLGYGSSDASDSQRSGSR